MTDNPGAPASAPVPEPAWASYKDDELLQMRICDLGVRIEGSMLEPEIARFYALIEERGLVLRPRCYLGDEWFSPDGVPAISIPFYLAHPRLRELELRQMLDVEGGDPGWCQMLLRHEYGHAFDHAYNVSARQDWQEVFGSLIEEYEPDTYTPRPYSKGFVRHLPNWYAQAHPTEDFAETFAVWLADPPEKWRERYAGWNALKKIEYVDRLVRELGKTKPLVTGGRRISEASKLKRTLAQYYAARRKTSAEEFPDFYDADLRAIFANSGPDDPPAAKIMRQHRAALIASLVQWTGQRRYTVSMLVNKLIQRCQKLRLRAPRDSSRMQFELGAYLAALVTNHLYTGRFKRSV